MYYDSSEVIINSSLFLNNKCQGYLPPKILQCNLFVETHTYTKHTHIPPWIPQQDLFSLPPSSSLSFCSVRQVNENNKITLCISSVPWMASSIYNQREILEPKGGGKKRKKARAWGEARKSCMSKIPALSMHAFYISLSSWVRQFVN